MAASVVSICVCLALLGVVSAIPAGSDLQHLSEQYHQEAFERITNQLFPPLKAKPLYRTIKTFVQAVDGVDLYTVAFVPIDLKKSHYDTVMIRTPYGTDGLKGEGETYVSQGFAAVMQDFRGRYRSKGTFQCWFNASTDAASTINWIIAQPWSTRSTSAPGIALYFSEVAAPPAAVATALFPVVGTAELHTTVFQGGAYRYSLMHGWLNGINEPAFEANYTAHEGLTEYWNNVTMTDKWDRVTAPAVHLTGWYDIFNQQQIDAYNAYQTKSTVGQGLNFLVILPTGHCPGGEIPWPDGTLGFTYANELALLLFKARGSDVQLRAAAERTLAGLPAVVWYVLGPGLPGTKGNYWTNASAFPTSSDTSFYLNGDGTLSLTPPAQEGTRSFVYNPMNPVPTLGGNNLLLPQCGPWDQAQLEKRSDVLVYTSARLTSAFAITGKMRAMLVVSSNCTDTDFTVKVTDVFPNGSSLLIQDGIVRMRWRNGGSTPTLITPGYVYGVEVDVWTTSYIFNEGHAVRVDISSSNYPRFSANPNNGLPLNQQGPLIPAYNTILSGPLHPSRLILPVVALDALPPTMPTIEH